MTNRPPLTPPASGRGTYTLKPQDSGYVLLRNDKPLNTPDGHLFLLPLQALAEKIADEWRAQGEKIKPDTMPLTQLAATTLDITRAKKSDIARQVAAYGASDLLCHRADAPPELAERQAKIWQPWLDWAETHYGARLNVGQGIIPVVHPEQSLGALREVVAGYDDFCLTGLQQAVSVSGSLIFGLALAEQKTSVSEVFEAAELDSLFQMQKWGEDPATLKRHESVKRELAVCEAWFGLLKPATA